MPIPPEPGPKAIVTHNDEGGVWIDGLIARAQVAAAIVADALAACAKAGVQ